MTSEQKKAQEDHRKRHIKRLHSTGRIELWRISEAMDYQKTPTEIETDPAWDERTIKEFWAFQKIRNKEIEKELD